MRTSSDRILTTHVGSLRRSEVVGTGIFAIEAQSEGGDGGGEPVEMDRHNRTVARAVDVVARQAGIVRPSMRIHASAILFDNDGVLVDSHDEVEQAWRQLAGEFGLDAETLLPELIGVRAIDTLSRYLPPDRCSEAVDRLEDLEVGLAAGTRPLTGAVALLQQLSGLDEARWTIVTSATRRLAVARWEGAGITIPPLTVTADDVSRGKPDPEPFLVGARELGVDPSHCVVFEDSPSGGAAGVAAGASVVAVGSIEWAARPVARIQTLDQVSVTAGGDGELVISLRPPMSPST